MYDGSLDAGRIISAFIRNVPDCYIRDFRVNGGQIAICRGYRDVGDYRQSYRQVVSETLCNLPLGNVRATSMYEGVRQFRPGWRMEFAKARKHLTWAQMKRITRTLRAGEVFKGLPLWAAR